MRASVSKCAIALWNLILGLSGQVEAGTPTVSVDANAAAKCAIKRDYRSARAIVLAVPNSAEESVGLAAIAPALLACGGQSISSLSYDQRTLLIGVFSARIAEEFGILRSSWSNGAPDLDAFARMMANRTHGYPPRAAMAKCAFEVDTNRSVKFVKSRSGSTAETRAFNAIQPTLSRCVDAGSQIASSKALLRSEMARAYVRHICVPNDPIPAAVASKGAIH